MEPRPQSCHRQVYGNSAVFGQLAEQVLIAGDQMVLGDYGDRIPELAEYLEHTAGNLQFLLEWLIGICYATEGHNSWPPFLRTELSPQEIARIFLYQDLGFEIQTGGVAEVLMSRAGIAVYAAVLASPVWVDTEVKTDVGALVGGDNGT